MGEIGRMWRCLANFGKLGECLEGWLSFREIKQLSQSYRFYNYFHSFQLLIKASFILNKSNNGFRL